MNIGMATDTYLPRINGVVHSIRTFRQELIRMGHRVILFAPRFPNYKETDFDIWRFPSHTAFANPEDRLPNPFYLESRIMLKGLPDLNLDVIHTHTPFSLGVTFMEWGRRRGIPLVHTYHTLFETYVPHYFKFMPKAMGQMLVSWGSRSFCDRHDRIVAPSRAMQKVLRRYGVTKPITVVPTGVDLEAFSHSDRNRMRRQLGFAPEDRLLLTMGRVAGEKNLSFLFEVMVKLRFLQPRARLVVAGEGPALKSAKQECQRRGLENQVLFTGYVTGQDWVDTYAAADLHLLASVTETQALVLIEAMAAGVPCVAVAAMGVRDIMAEGGGLAVPLNTDEFVSAINQLLSDDEFYKQKQAEARRQAKAWSAETKAKELLAVYQEMVG